LANQSINLSQGINLFLAYQY